MKRTRELTHNSTLSSLVAVKAPTPDSKCPLETDEFIELSVNNIELVSGGVSQSVGSLFITNKKLFWFSYKDKNDGTIHLSSGFSILYPHIIIHAISRDVESFPSPCIFLQLHDSVDSGEGDVDSFTYEDVDNATQIESDSEPLNMGCPRSMSEVLLIPRDDSVEEELLDSIFESISKCSAMNPDEGIDEDYTGDDNGFASFVSSFMSGSFNTDCHLEQAFTPEQMAMLNKYDSMLEESENSTVEKEL